MRTGHAILQGQLNTMEKSLSDAIEDIKKKLPQAQQKLYAGELRVGEVLLKAVQHVLGDSEPDMVAYIIAFKSPTGEEPAGAGGVDDSRSNLAGSRLGKATPCGS